MGFYAEIVHFDTASTVNLSLTKFSNSDMPKLVIFLTMNSSALGSGTSPTMCLGFEDSSGNRFTAAQAYKDNVTNQAYASGHVDSTSYGFQWGYLSSVTGQTIVARATVTDWAYDNLEVTFSTVPGTAIKCSALVLGGSDFTPGVPSIKTQNGSTGSRNVTGLGYDPNGMFIINGTIAASGQTAHSWIGVVDADGNEMGIWGLSNGFGNGVRRKQRLDAMGMHSWNGAEYSRQEFTSWDSGGYTYNDALSYNTARYIHIPFRIASTGGRCELDVNSWASTSLQTQTVSSGHTPIALFSLGYCGASSASDLTTACALGVGFADFTNEACGTLYVSGTYPSNSRCGLYFQTTAFHAGMSAYNTVAHQLVQSSTSSGQYVVYPSLQAGYETGILSFLQKDDDNSSSSSCSSNSSSSSSSASSNSSSSSSSCSSASSNSSSSCSSASSNSSSSCSSLSSASSNSSSSCSSASSNSSSSCSSLSSESSSASSSSSSSCSSASSESSSPSSSSSSSSSASSASSESSSASSSSSSCSSNSSSQSSASSQSSQSSASSNSSSSSSSHSSSLSSSSSSCSSTTFTQLAAYCWKPLDAGADWTAPQGGSLYDLLDSGNLWGAASL